LPGVPDSMNIGAAVVQIKFDLQWRRAALGPCMAMLGCTLSASLSAAEQSLVAYRVEGSQIRVPLTVQAGDPVRGKTAVLSRDGGNCFLCHTVPDAGETPLGNIGPPLAGVGKRLTAAQLRLRLVDSTRINRASVMPAYYRTKGMRNVAPAYFGKPLLTAQQVEDVVAYLLTLRN
jgi:L-cysteine S-thiosulfotransferase